MISKPKKAYVWIWLPNATEPIPAGVLSQAGEQFVFNYGKSYLARADAISIYMPELPLQSGMQVPFAGLQMPSCIRDSSPDAWGRRVLMNRTPSADLNELFFLLQSGSDRIGALDFQHSPTEYIPRDPNHATLEELLHSAERVEQGLPLSAALDHGLFHGSSLGGARPKALIEAENKQYIAKFSSSSDHYNIVKAEYIAMSLAHLLGLKVASVKLVKAAQKDVLLIERFDREKTKKGWTRKALVSTLTLLELDEMMARYASYEDLAEIIRHRFTEPKTNLEELFKRLIFNVLSGNTDDHARNHAAFWDGKMLTLTPAYDICPQGRAGNEASQAMLIVNQNRMSKLSTCLEAAPNFMISAKNAKEIIDYQVQMIHKNWSSVCERADLTKTDRAFLWERQFLNPFVFED